VHPSAPDQITRTPRPPLSPPLVASPHRKRFKQCVDFSLGLDALGLEVFETLLQKQVVPCSGTGRPISIKEHSFKFFRKLYFCAFVTDPSSCLIRIFPPCCLHLLACCCRRHRHCICAHLFAARIPENKKISKTTSDQTSTARKTKGGWKSVAR